MDEWIYDRIIEDLQMNGEESAKEKYIFYQNKSILSKYIKKVKDKLIENNLSNIIKEDS